MPKRKFQIDMANLTTLIGTYEVHGSNLLRADDGLTLVVATRKQSSIKKTANYLLLKLNESFKYVSSLYPRGLNECGAKKFSIDYSGKRYVAEYSCDSTHVFIDSIN